MRIVTDGKQYAIQKGWLFKKYLSLYSADNWWSLRDSYEFCWGNKERVKGMYDFMKRKEYIREVRGDEL